GPLAGLLRLVECGQSFVLRTGALLRELALLRAATPDEDPAGLAFGFHCEIARGALEGARWMKRTTGLRIIALSGGVFQNVLLQDLLVPALRREGFEVFRNRSVPPGDGGIALGQVYFVPGNL
ncbi:MAG: hypothetical protein JW820_02460, partial [Spirochaetales bacterium]|nr:hypothetical protein [Spirochaetales bacterium]